MKDVLTTHDIATLCDVDITTVINWIDTGKLSAYKTPGGHRRIPRREFIRFLKEYHLPIPRGVKGRDHHILVVEDDAELREFIRELIEARYPECRIIEAEDGFSAGKLIAEMKPVLIVLDVRLPGIDGNIVCHRIREDRRLNNCKILAVTAYGEKAERAVMDAGADACLMKPFTAEEIYRHLDALLPDEK